MRSIDEYLDAAKLRNNVPSDAQLSTLVGVRQSVISCMRTRRSWPSDATMVRIAELAGVDPHEGLVDLSIWRNGDNGHVQALWADLKKKLTPIAASLCLIMGLSAALPHEAKAAPHSVSDLMIMEINIPSHQSFTVCSVSALCTPASIISITVMAWLAVTGFGFRPLIVSATSV